MQLNETDTIKVDFYPFWTELQGRQFTRTFDTLQTWHRVKQHLRQDYLAIIVQQKEGDNWKELKDETVESSLFNRGSFTYIETPKPIL